MSSAIHQARAEGVLLELTRRKSALELTFMASRMFADARDRLQDFLRHSHPDWTEAKIHAELLRRIHGSA